MERKIQVDPEGDSELAKIMLSRIESWEIKTNEHTVQALQKLIIQ